MARPLLVLVSGHPGAGKTTLGRALGDAMHLPHVNRDRIASGMWHTAPTEDRDQRLEVRVQRQRDEIANPLDLGVPVLEVDTTNGYDPSIDELVEAIRRA